MHPFPLCSFDSILYPCPSLCLPGPLPHSHLDTLYPPNPLQNPGPTMVELLLTLPPTHKLPSHFTALFLPETPTLLPHCSSFKGNFQHPLLHEALPCPHRPCRYSVGLLNSGPLTIIPPHSPWQTRTSTRAGAMSYSAQHSQYPPLGLRLCWMVDEELVPSVELFPGFCHRCPCISHILGPHFGA